MPVVIGAAFVAGIAQSNVLIAYITLRTNHSPDALLGRVGSTARLVSVGLTPIGLLTAGFIIDATNGATALAAMGLWSLALTVAFGLSATVRERVTRRPAGGLRAVRGRIEIRPVVSDRDGRGVGGRRAAARSRGGRGAAARGHGGHGPTQAGAGRVRGPARTLFGAGTSVGSPWIGRRCDADPRVSAPHGGGDGRASSRRRDE